MAFGIIIGVVLGVSIGIIVGNGYILAMGPVFGIFIGLAAWFILSSNTTTY